MSKDKVHGKASLPVARLRTWGAWASASIRPGKPTGVGVRPWEAVVPRYRNAVGNRDPETYEQVLDQFAVESNRRYRKDRAGRGETYCNIFVWDVTRAMGAEIPHWVNVEGTRTRVHRGLETTANDAIGWLRLHGAATGWHEVDAVNAQRYANHGSPTVAALHLPEGIGHLAMVRPGSLDEHGPYLTQAGERNSCAIRAAEAFGAAWSAGAVTFFVHD